MKKILTLSLNQIYLDYINNFISIEKFAEYYDIELSVAKKLFQSINSIHNQ